MNCNVDSSRRLTVSILEKFSLHFWPLTLWKCAKILVIFSLQNFESLDIKYKNLHFLFYSKDHRRERTKRNLCDELTELLNIMLLIDAYYELVAACRRNGEIGRQEGQVLSFSR